MTDTCAWTLFWVFYLFLGLWLLGHSPIDLFKSARKWWRERLDAWEYREWATGNPAAREPKTLPPPPQPFKFQEETPPFSHPFPHWGVADMQGELQIQAWDRTFVVKNARWLKVSKDGRMVRAAYDIEPAPQAVPVTLTIRRRKKGKKLGGFLNWVAPLDPLTKDLAISEAPVGALKDLGGFKLAPGMAALDKAFRPKASRPKGRK